MKIDTNVSLSSFCLNYNQSLFLKRIAQTLFPSKNMLHLKLLQRYSYSYQKYSFIIRHVKKIDMKLHFMKRYQIGK